MLIFQKFSLNTPWSVLFATWRWDMRIVERGRLPVKVLPIAAIGKSLGQHFCVVSRYCNFAPDFKDTGNNSGYRYKTI